MRVTSQMLTNSMLSNINRNKINMSTLEEQYSSGKKIQRPSDDPIIAVRALKLRSTLAQVDQYVEKNIPDAQAWVNVTESALKNVNSILKQMNTYCVQGANDTLTATNRESILKNLMELKDHIYQEGNAEYAGRYVFTGFKTDTPLIFDERPENTSYQITQKFTADDVTVHKTIVGAMDASSATLDDPTISVDDFLTAPTVKSCYRLQLGYSNLDELKEIQIGTGTPLDINALIAADKLKEKDSSETDRYSPAADEIYYLKDSGEIIFGESYYTDIKAADELSVIYNKSKFDKGDLRPEHYFDCTVTNTADGTATPVVYTKKEQNIEYEINFNQSLRINTEASSCITQAIGRTVDDIETAIYNVKDIESKIAAVNEKLKVTTDLDQKEALNKLNDQLDTELTLANSLLQEKFAAGIKATQTFQNNTNEAVADLGARSKRLELTLSRLESQQVELTDLKSTNEDVDLVETVINYKSAESIYTASLSAAGGIVKTSLLDFL